MRLSVVVILISCVTGTFFHPRTTVKSPLRQSYSMRMVVSERLTTVQAAADFKNDFVAGLKFVLVPQVEWKKQAAAARRAKEALSSSTTPDVSSDEVDIPYSSNIEISSYELPDAELVNEVVSAAPDADLSMVPLSLSSNSNLFTAPVNIPDATTESTSIVAPDTAMVSSSIVIPDAGLDTLPLENLDAATVPGSIYEMGSDAMRSVSSDISSVIPSLPTSKIMTIHDLTLLRETMMKAFPERSSFEISDMTSRLAEITSTVQERGRLFQAPDFLHELAVDVPSLMTLLGDKYQKVLLDVVSSDTSPSVVLSQLKDRIVSMEALELQYRSADLPEISFVPSIPMDKFDAVFENINQLSQMKGWTLPDLVQSLNFHELGGWYSGTIVGVFLVASLLANSKTPKTPKLAEVVGRVPLQTVSDLPSIDYQVGSASAAIAAQMKEDKLRLENLVSDLTIAVTVLSRELRELKLDKARTEYELAAMRSDVRTLRNAIDVNIHADRVLRKQAEISERNEKELKAQLKVAQMKVLALEREKLSLKSEINGLNGAQQFVNVKIPPIPPSIPPPSSFIPSTDKVWFANFVSVAPATSGI